MSQQHWDETYDFVVVGSGAGGMSAAVVAHELGGRSLVLEKTDKYGGTTALSGGVIWIPNNDSMKAAGIDDNETDSYNYLRRVVGDGVSQAKLRAYIHNGNEMLRFLSNTPIRYMACDRYADYYPEFDGGKLGGRSMEPVPVRRTRLGEAFSQQRFPEYLKGFMRFASTVKEGREIMDTTLKGYLYMARNMLRYYLDIPGRLKGLPDIRLTLGRGAVANCRLAMLQRDIPLWLNADASELIEENGAVVGLRVNHNGKLRNIRAEKGVLLAAGGMGQNTEMRQQYGQLPTGESWSSEGPGNVGDGIRMGQSLGAAVEFMGSAWWTPSIKTPTGEMLALISGKSMPGSIFVDQTGRRFCNEAEPYEDLVKNLWENHEKGNPSVPVYMVFDATYRHKYTAGIIPPAKIQPDSQLPQEYFDSGLLVKADTLAGLAGKLGLPADALVATVERQNEFARTGKDLDFQRGDSMHDRYYSDPQVEPNPNMAPIEEGPFYAVAVYPGDLGTKGGLKCDEYARVQKESGEVIPGLYVTGNCAGSVMADSYPGAGSTIGPSMTFGYVAARHAMAAQVKSEPHAEPAVAVG